MKLIFEDRQSRIIKEKKEIRFTSFSTYHLIIITARAKSEKQLGNQVSDDEDLTVKLDNKSFSKPGSTRLIDIPAAIPDPIKGAVFFHSSDLPQEEFVTKYVPGSIFAKQIGDILFYQSPS